MEIHAGTFTANGIDYPVNLVIEIDKKDKNTIKTQVYLDVVGVSSRMYLRLAILQDSEFKIIGHEKPCCWNDGQITFKTAESLHDEVGLVVLYIENDTNTIIQRMTTVINNGSMNYEKVYPPLDPRNR